MRLVGVAWVTVVVVGLVAVATIRSGRARRHEAATDSLAAGVPPAGEPPPAATPLRPPFSDWLARVPDPRSEASEDEHLPPSIRNRPTRAQLREDLVKRVLESGPAQPWSRDAEHMFDASIGALSAPLQEKVRWGATRCGAIGCIKDVTLADPAAAVALREELRERDGAPLRTWQGFIQYSPPVATPTGGVTVTWALMKPETTQREAP